MCKLNTLEPFEDQDLPVNELDGSEEEETVTVVLEEAKEKWDCESICSTYSNVYNHPQLIKYQPKPKQIRLSSKTGIPLNVLPKKGLTAKQVERMQMINNSDLPKTSTQPRLKKGKQRGQKSTKASYQRRAQGTESGEESQQISLQTGEKKAGKRAAELEEEC